MDENNPHIRAYKQLAEEYLGQPLEFEYIGGATDSRAFAERGSVVIMHSGSGDGMHAAGEYVVWQSVEQLAEIQGGFAAAGGKRFLTSVDAVGEQNRVQFQSRRPFRGFCRREQADPAVAAEPFPFSAGFPVRSGAADAADAGQNLFLRF